MARLTTDKPGRLQWLAASKTLGSAQAALAATARNTRYCARRRAPTASLRRPGSAHAIAATHSDRHTTPSKAKAMPQKPKPPSQVTFEEFWRRAVFGIICGTVTGFTVGAVDAYKLFKGGTVKQPDLPRVAFHEMGRSAVIVAGFFGIYQTVKTGLGFAGIDYPEVKVGTATMIGAAPLSITPGLRRYVPYCLTLVAVDTYHSYWAPGADER